LSEIGQVRWMTGRGRAYYDKDGTPVRLAGVGIDITDRKQALEELAGHRENLEEMVRLRTGELEASHEKLRLSERMAALGTLAAGWGTTWATCCCRFRRGWMCCGPGSFHRRVLRT